jgi:3-hydroxyisobutyrate dehydrogenase-like beta-hydroxyacid dehydrogenase
VASTWGIIGCGEAGSTFAAHLSRQDGINVMITDPALELARLGGTSAQIVEDVPSLVRSADICLSLVTPNAALQVARAAAAAWRQGLFVDLNSVSPAEKRQMTALFPAGGFVGGAILGSIAGEGAASRVVLDGPSAAQAEMLLNSAGFRSRAISAVPGAAAAMKLCRSIFMKGIECLLVETILAASEFEITDAVLASVEDTLEGYGFGPMVEMLVTTHAVHCERRSEEMRRVTDMLSAMGLPNAMSAASITLLSMSAATGLTRHVGGVLPSSSGVVIEYLKRSYKEKG